MISKVVGLSLILLLGIAPEAKADRTPLEQLRNGYYSICADELAPNDRVTVIQCFAFRKVGNRVIGLHHATNFKDPGLCLQGEVRGNTITGSGVDFMRMIFGEAEALETAQVVVGRGLREVGTSESISLRMGNPVMGRGRMNGNPHIIVHYRSMIFDSKSYKYLHSYRPDSDSWLRQLGESGDCRNAHTDIYIGSAVIQ